MRAAGTLPQVGERWYLPRWLPAFLVILPFVVLAAFGARSHFQHDYNKDVYEHRQAPVALVASAIASIERAGRRPVLLAATSKELAPFASEGTITRAMNVKTAEDGKYILSKPYGISRQKTMTAWMWQPVR